MFNKKDYFNQISAVSSFGGKHSNIAHYMQEKVDEYMKAHEKEIREALLNGGATIEQIDVIIQRMKKNAQAHLMQEFEKNIK